MDFGTECLQINPGSVVVFGGARGEYPNIAKPQSLPL